MEPPIAYFSMEIALQNDIPTYSGGLGVLAGDTIRAAADLRIPMMAVSLLYRKGHFIQRLDEEGRQTESPVSWNVEASVTELAPRVPVTIEGRQVQVRGWQYEVRGLDGFVVPVYLLDTDLEENVPEDRTLTHQLYGGDGRYRLCQEILLGIGGLRLLRALGVEQIRRFHLNEGHASLLTLELLAERLRWDKREQVTQEDLEAVRAQCVFTTHTPVPAGHDQFPMDLVERVLGTRREFAAFPDIFCCDGKLNMTFLALNLSHYVNGVAKKHGAISREMFPRYDIRHITNGVHVTTWVAPSFQKIFDRSMPGWREDNFNLRYAVNLPRFEVWEAHLQAKQALLERIQRDTGLAMDESVLTLGFARRATAYKRADLLFSDPARLKKLAAKTGRLQLVYAGKAHPHDETGKQMIQRIFKAKAELAPQIQVAYLANYDLELAKLMVAGVDVWLNTPQPPLEASGTSGMKAAINGVPSFSVLDGWWIEGYLEGVTGWAFGGGGNGNPNDEEQAAQDATSLYDKLEGHVIPLFQNSRERFIDVMRQAIALNGSFFNTQRMIRQYVVNAYF
ncbi:MAG TPA: alpha-glucan family phosphorylase [Candidatus Omnitrophica bacterium]|nr:MAG: alpha-glucan phosphorylase [Omnitrophica WOR_2 bacterium GWA2_63_20]OGX17603.1 MAG: alpha-glucan phosphorylase [Omnitrophica WOR_2 bacterium GWF2_63_9]OGX36454.1 MAG: alpha-glucan phosphorylase [Omnitrophica WOR_2 bacterium RIFCSPHIGHO2_02_FULL_63_39]OGX44843.1 MAG: alpha-glucan phosphorylase [Omnitrophica WOR_2 bacterium RIFCSPLOWO2_02_FULL_63_16]OGX48074.1 MAG: alpha-glucan phosphorylase [Omnitrophica WOR_2 bacterium RIFCSPLOWO2_12_FULL_63_16]HBH97111.1 alpha-glucan family phosphoryl